MTCRLAFICGLGASHHATPGTGTLHPPPFQSQRITALSPGPVLHCTYRGRAAPQAYDVLSDPDMRAIFDKYGEEVLKGEGSPGTPERHGTTDEDCGVMNRTNSSGRFHYVFNRDPEAMFANFFKGDTARRMRGYAPSILGALARCDAKAVG
jgi:hypothetical protein